MRNQKLRDKVAIVTGASSGIGREIALELARKGARLSLAARNTMALEEVAGAIEAPGGEALVVTTDVTRQRQVRQLVAETLARWGRVDILVASAGEYVRCPVADLTLTELKSLDAGTWFDARFADERLPTLEESLDLAQDRIGVYVEIKNSADDRKLMNDIWQLAEEDQHRFRPDQRREMMRLIEASGSRNLVLTRKVIAAIRARDMARQVVIQSFSPIVCAVALEEAPELCTELLGGDDDCCNSIAGA